MMCKFCEIQHTDEVVLEVGSVFCFEDGFPVTDGHTLILPKRHATNYFELTSKEIWDTHEALKILQKRFVDYQGVYNFNIGWNVGEAAGQTVDHAHCHFIPRRMFDTEDPVGGVRGVIPGMANYKTW